MKLRDAIIAYSKWTACVYGALIRQTIMPYDAFDKVQQLKKGLRAWIGEELLNTRL
jgi:hypothetical protein